MTLTIVPYRPRPRVSEADQKGMVHVLEDLLEKVRAGEISSLAVAVTYSDGGGSYGRAGSQDRELVGAIEEMKYKIISEFTR